MGDPACVTVDGSNIASVSNKGSISGVFSQAVTSRRPLLQTGGPGGKVFASFDGVDDVLVCPAVTIAPTSTLWMLAVHRAVLGSTYQGLVSTINQPTSGFGMAYATSAIHDWQPRDVIAHGNGYQAGRAPRAIVQTPASATDTLWHALSVLLGPVPAAEIDGNVCPLRASAGVAFPAYTGQLLIGAISSGAERLNGGIAEILIVADPTRDQIDRATGYACHKYGLQSLMPASHPYRWRRP